MLLRKLFFCGVLALFALHPGAAPAVTVSWDFAGGLDHSNFTYSTNSNVTLTDTAGELQLTKPAQWSGSNLIQGGYIRPNFLLQGNFDVQVDYKINATPLNDGVAIHMELWNPYSYLARANDNGQGQTYYVYRDPPRAYYGGRSTPDNQGTFRAVRSGGTVTFYEKASGAPSWTTIYTDSSFGSQDIHFDLAVQDSQYATPYAKSFDASFDNLRVTADSLSGYSPVPLPPTALLLGSGLLGLVG